MPWPCSGSPVALCRCGSRTYLVILVGTRSSATVPWLGRILLLHASTVFLYRDVETVVCLQAWSAARTRMLLNICQGVVSFLRAAGGWPSEAEIQSCLRQQEGYSPSSGAAVPIGDRGGVPASAADVSLSEVLADTHAVAAEQAREPTALLLPPARKLHILEKLYARVHRTYPDLPGPSPP